MGTWRTGDWEGNCKHGVWKVEGMEKTCRNCAENFNCMAGEYPPKMTDKGTVKMEVITDMPRTCPGDNDQYELPLVFAE